MKEYLVFTTLLLAGCGGSGAGNDGLFFGGTTSTTTASNGQQFATTTPSSFRGATYQARVTRHILDENGQRTTVVTTETVTLAPGATGDLPYIASMTLDGQTVSFSATNPTELNGQDYFLYTLGNGSHSTVVGAYSYGYSLGGIDDEIYASVGFETNPDNLPTTGGATYAGILEAYGTVERDGVPGDGFSILGGMNMVADFNTAIISGSATDLDLTIFTVDAAPTYQVDATFDQTGIVGNGFETTFTLGCIDGFTCSSASTAGGTFYGPSGEEVSGLIIIDETATDTSNGEVLIFDGVGGFGASEQ